MGEREDFQPAILEYLGTHFPLGEWAFTNKIIRSRESNLYRVFNATNGQAVAVKVFHPSAKIEVPRVQFNALSKYQTAMTGEYQKQRVPRVYHFDEHQRYVLMEWLSGRELHHHLWRAIYNPGKRNKLAEQAGKWLRCFHDASGLTLEKINTVEITERLNKRLVRTQGQSAVLEHPKFIATLKALNHDLQQLGEIETHHAVTHDDFTPTNIIVQDDAFIGFDIWALGRKPIVSDLARMIVYLSIAYPPLFGREGPMKHGTCNAFLRGYGDAVIANNQCLLKHAIIAELLRRWVVIASRPSLFSKLITRKYQISMIESMIDQSLS